MSTGLRLGIMMLALSGCATQVVSPDVTGQLFIRGKTLIADGRFDEGMALVEKAVSLQPDRVEFRTYLSTQRELYITRMLTISDGQREMGHWAEAEAGYEKVLDVDSKNQRAQEGIRAIVSGRKLQDMLHQVESLLAKGDIDGAQVSVRQILAENPKNLSARKIYEQIEHQRMEKYLTPQKLKDVFKKPVTLEFKDITLKAVFELISQSSGINFTFDSSVTLDKKINVFLRDNSVDDVIHFLLTTNQLEKKILNDNTVLIFPRSKLQEYQELFVRSFYLSSIDAKRAMNLVKTILKSKDVYIDEKLNTLVIRDTPEAIALAEKLITAQDLPDPEVMLEVEVMEVSKEHLENIGLKYPTKASLGVRGSTTNSDGSTSLTPGQLTFSELEHFNSGLGIFQITDPVLAFNLLSQDTNTNLLANPHIRVKNKEKAKVHIGDKIPVITSTANATGFVSQSVNYLDVGIKLDVEPTILLQDEVSIKVGLEVSNQTGQIQTTSGTLTYSIGTRNANTVLRLKNGETQVLAGLYRDDVQDINDNVPGFSNLPLIGKLFSNKNKDRQKKEIVLLITPRIISNITPPDASYVTFASGVDASAGSGGIKSGANYDTSPPQASGAGVVKPVQTPESIQNQQAQSDRSFAESVLQSPQSATTQP
jgi:general secretion pathway protein D